GHVQSFAFVALVGASLGLCGCRLTVQDNQPPAVVATTSAAEVKVGAVVKLDASRTTDPDKDALTYAWTLQAPAGSKAVIANPRDPKTSFTTDVQGTFGITLEVADGKKHTVKKALSVKAVADKP